MRSARSGDCVLPQAGAKRCRADHKGIEGEHRTQRARMRRWREEHTLIERQIWSPSNDSGLKMVNWVSKSRPPQSPEDGQIYCILLIRIVFCHVYYCFWKNPLHCLFYVTMNMYFCFYLNTARHVVTVLLIFVNIFQLTYTFSHAHTEAHTHKHTCMISTQEEWRQPGTGAWLKRAEERLLLETKALHTLKKEKKKEEKMSGKTRYSRI